MEDLLLLNVGCLPLEATAISPNSSPTAIVLEYFVSTIQGGKDNGAASAIIVIRVSGVNRNKIVNSIIHRIE